MIVFDTEADDLLDGITKFWVFGWTTDGKEFHQTTNPDKFLEVLDQQEMAACHNCIRYDFPALLKILGYTYNGLKIDTLALSQYLYPSRPKHGLESWGEDLGVPKVYVDPDDWKDLDIAVARKRVVEDVKINTKLWKLQQRDLENLYDK